MLLQAITPCSEKLSGILQDNSELLAFSIMSATFLIALSYAISRIWGDEKIKIWAKQELWNLVLNGIVILLTLGLVDIFTSNLTNASNLDSFMNSIVNLGNTNIDTAKSIGGECLYDYSYKYTVKLMAISLEQAAINSWAYVHFVFLRSMRITTCPSNFLVCLLSAPTVTISPFLNMDWIVQTLGTFNRMLLTTVFLFAYSQGVLLILFMSSDFVRLLVFMFILRLLPFTRGFANVIFALVFAFMVFYPLIVALESYVFGVPEITDDGIVTSITEASSLSNVYYGRPEDNSQYLSSGDIGDIWDLSPPTYGTNIFLMYKNTPIININQIIVNYASLLFRIVLFGSINLILVALVIRELLRYSGESENLMEMFIRMGGVITW